MKKQSRAAVEVSFPAEDFRKAVQHEVWRSVNALAEATTNELKQVINREGTGQQWPGQKHKSSVPYAPPVVQTGALQNSWGTRLRPIKKFTKSYKSLRIGSMLNYAAFLEFGTKNTSGSAQNQGGKSSSKWRVAPRPYIEETIKITNEKHMDAMRRGFEKRLKSRLVQIRPSIKRIIG